jgi:2-keto-3-deoxy-6-phosphogluconate aldolase
MSDLIRKFRLVLEQGFVPICVGDRFDIQVLARASVEAGVKAIEITCRRPNARAEIGLVKRDFPQLVVLVGSVVDEGPMLKHLRRRQPQMPSIADLLDAGADGIVSALPLRPETVARVSRTHLVIPGVESMTEVVQAVEHGAHFAKLFTADLMGGCDRVRRLTCAATHGLPPLFVTGGIIQRRIRDYLEAGAAMLGSGWDVILGDRYAALQDRPNQAEMAVALRGFLDAFHASRTKLMPTWAESAHMSDNAFVASLAHYVPVEWVTDSEQR